MPSERLRLEGWSARRSRWPGAAVSGPRPKPLKCGEPPTRAGRLPLPGASRAVRHRGLSLRAAAGMGIRGRSPAERSHVAAGERGAERASGRAVPGGDFPPRDPTEGCRRVRAQLRSLPPRPGDKPSAPRPRRRPEREGGWSAHLAPVPPALPAPTAGSLLPFIIFGHIFSYLRALPHFLCIRGTFPSQSFPPSPKFSSRDLPPPGAPSRREEGTGGAPTWSPGGWARAAAVGPRRRAGAAESARAPVRVPFTSRRRLRAAPAASASASPLGWRRPRMSRGAR